MKPLITVEGKVVLVTGGSRGIGEAIAQALGQSGARVAIASRKNENVAAALERLKAAGVEVWGKACHTGKAEEVEQLVDDVVAHFGQIDVLVNNAATNPYFGPLLGLAESAFDKTVEVNLKGYISAAMAVSHHLISRGAPGSIVNLASIAGLTGSPLQAIYGMTKAAVISMTQSLACELGPSGIRVNAIAPGLIETKFAAAIVENEGLSRRFSERTPLGRHGKPEEVAGAALFLASDAASFVTGHTLVVDGGWLIGGG